MSHRITALESPEQAEKVSHLGREVYGTAHPVGLYTRPEELWASNQAGTTLSVVALDPEMTVVGHAALFGSAPNPRLLEVGAELIHPNARRTVMSAALLTELLKLARDRDLCDWVFTESDCHHRTTQRTSGRQGFIETAVEIDLRPAEESAEGRVSTLLSFLPIKDKGGADLLLPDRYRGILGEIYETLAVQRRLQTAPDEDPPEPGKYIRYRDDQTDFLRVTAETIGIDLPEQLEQEAAVTQLALPLDSPWVDFAVWSARQAGFFLAGLLPAWSGVDNLLLQRLSDSTEWSRIALESNFAKQLLEVIKVDQESSGPSEPIDTLEEAQ